MARTKTWVMLAGVLFLIMAGLTLLTALVSKAPPGAAGAGFKVGQLFGSAIGVLLYVIPGLKLVRYAKHIGQLLQSRRSHDLELALNEHRGFWKFVGIVTIVLLSLMVLGILAGIAMAGSRH